MTWVTLSSTTWAEAPGYMVEMVMLGGAILGYCSTGRVSTANSPDSMMTIAITHANMGRSIKKRDMFLSCYHELVDALYSTVVTLAWGLIFCNPSTTTRSPGARPAEITHWSLTAWETSTG